MSASSPDAEADSFGSDAIKNMIVASELTSSSWATFYKKLQLLTSSAVESMPPHHIKVVKSDTGYIVSIHGPVYNYDHYGTKIWG